MKIKYFAWLSSKGEKALKLDGSAYAGDILNCPDKYKHLIDDDKRNGRRYIAVNSLPQEESDDGKGN